MNRSRRHAERNFLAQPLLGENLKRKLGLSRCPVVQSARDVSRIFKHISQFDREVMIAGTLDCKSRLLCWSLLAVGSSEWLIVRVGDAFADAIRMSASGVFLVHNHPSGSLEPSREDIDLTRNVERAGKLLGYTLFDHVIVAKTGHRGLITAPRFNSPVLRIKQLAAAANH